MPKVLAKMDSLNIHLTRIGKSSTVAETSRHSRWKFKRELTFSTPNVGGYFIVSVDGVDASSTALHKALRRKILHIRGDI